MREWLHRSVDELLEEMLMVRAALQWRVPVKRNWNRRMGRGRMLPAGQRLRSDQKAQLALKHLQVEGLGPIEAGVPRQQTSPKCTNSSHLDNKLCLSLD